MATSWHHPIASSDSIMGSLHRMWVVRQVQASLDYLPLTTHSLLFTTYYLLLTTYYLLLMVV